MARIVIVSEELGNRVIDLKLGVNRFGRSPANEVQIEHPTISALHCEVVLGDGTVRLRDCDSTNGTFVAGERIKDAVLTAGQTFFLGEVKCLLEDAEVSIAIPKFAVQRPAPPVVLSNGSVLCPRHPESQATHQCTQCREVLCDACVHRLRRRGGKLLKLCPLCSHECVPLGPKRPRKKSFLGFLQKTVKLPFLRERGKE
jgi:hypothetical protein